MTDEALPPDELPAMDEEPSDPIPDETGVAPGEDDPNEGHSPVEEN
jgi:hypothetical protein